MIQRWPEERAALSKKAGFKDESACSSSVYLAALAQSKLAMQLSVPCKGKATPTKSSPMYQGS
eukprot:336487-Pelagomonas_calceolata.AAC.2